MIKSSDPKFIVNDQTVGSDQLLDFINQATIEFVSVDIEFDGTLRDVPKIGKDSIRSIIDSIDKNLSPEMDYLHQQLEYFYERIMYQHYIDHQMIVTCTSCQQELILHPVYSYANKRIVYPSDKDLYHDIVGRYKICEKCSTCFCARCQSIGYDPKLINHQQYNICKANDLRDEMNRIGLMMFYVVKKSTKISLSKDVLWEIWQNVKIYYAQKIKIKN